MIYMPALLKAYLAHTMDFLPFGESAGTRGGPLVDCTVCCGCGGMFVPKGI
jgi:hypothetical protein